MVTHYVSPSQNNFFIVNTDQASGAYKQVLGSYNTDGMDPKGVVAVSGPRAILVGINGQEYQVLDITTETATPLPKCGGLDIPTGIHGVSTVFTDSERAYSYLITGDSTSELKIIEGGPGPSGSHYSLDGEFVSRIFDVQGLASNSAQAAFNTVRASIVRPSLVTDLTLQVAVAAPESGDCTGANYVFVGPDGQASSYFTSQDDTTIHGDIPFASSGGGYVNPGRCFRYKAYLQTTDPLLTPQLEDITISFSP